MRTIVRCAILWILIALGLTAIGVVFLALRRHIYKELDECYARVALKYKGSANDYFEAEWDRMACQVAFVAKEYGLHATPEETHVDDQYSGRRWYLYKPYFLELLRRQESDMAPLMEPIREVSEFWDPASTHSESKVGYEPSVDIDSFDIKPVVLTTYSRRLTPLSSLCINRTPTNLFTTHSDVCQFEAVSNLKDSIDKLTVDSIVPLAEKLHRANRWQCGYLSWFWCRWGLVDHCVC